MKYMRDLGSAVVITGASGFVGRALHMALPQAHVLDRKQHCFDDPTTLKSLMRNRKVIFHLAGINAGSGFMPSADELMHNNVMATRNLLEAIRRYNKEKPLVVLVSSIHVYGKSDKPLTEESPVVPTSLYGMTKLMQELLIEQAARLGLISYCILRVSNIYGKGCRPYYNSAVATFCDKLRKRETIEIFGKGKSELDLVHVDDVVSILLKASLLAKAANPVYNVAYGKSVTVMQVIQALSKASKIEGRLKILDNPPVRIRINNKKILNTLKGYAWIDLKRGMQMTWGINEKG